MAAKREPYSPQSPKTLISRKVPNGSYKKHRPIPSRHSLWLRLRRYLREYLVLQRTGLDYIRNPGHCVTRAHYHAVCKLRPLSKVNAGLGCRSPVQQEILQLDSVIRTTRSGLALTVDDRTPGPATNTGPC
jgi:hypothetical protein